MILKAKMWSKPSVERTKKEKTGLFGCLIRFELVTVDTLHHKCVKRGKTQCALEVKHWDNTGWNAPQGSNQPWDKHFTSWKWSPSYLSELPWHSISLPTFSINSCPNNCSGHGRCSTANSVSGRVYCECEDYWKGEACSIPYCRDNCGSPDHGYCDLTGEKLCVCNDSWQGEGGGAAGTGRDWSPKGQRGTYGRLSLYNLRRREETFKEMKQKRIWGTGNKWFGLQL